MEIGEGGQGNGGRGGAKGGVGGQVVTHAWGWLLAWSHESATVILKCGAQLEFSAKCVP